jgi:uncharacterized membrane protein
MRYLAAFLFALAVLPAGAFAQGDTAEPGPEYVEKAVVTGVANERSYIPPGTTAASPVQTLTARVEDGPDAGAAVTFDNDFTQLRAGDQFYLRHSVTDAVADLYAVADAYRLNVLVALAAVFVALLFIFGGLQGIRGLASLIGSLVLIFYLLLPGILAGYPPVLISIGVSALIIIAGSYITHGWNRTTTSAVLGMLAVVVVTGFASYFVVHAARLSGYNSEEASYLHFGTGGTVDLAGVLLGGILIGLLGVLYDIAIGQAVAVEELMSAGAHLTDWQVYRRALRIGREHIGALVNTLAIAYVGASLPLLLLFKLTGSGSTAYIVNGEIIATELVRILMGAIGIILAVPATTLIAVRLLRTGKGVQ